MDLAQHYNNLYHESLQKIKTDHYQVDHLIDSLSDNRYGLTLLFRPDEKVKSAIEGFLDEAKKVEPHQYFYPASDIHVTVMSVISCYEGFDLFKIALKEYIDIIQECIKGMSRFDIEFRGLTASPSCLIVQGFPKDDTLNKIRDSLRENFKNSDLEQSLDKRYTLKTAHATVLRLRDKLNNKDEFINKIEEYRNRYFGCSTVKSVELVSNDWYMRKNRVKELYSFRLR
ncbi:MAG: mutarotase [Anaerophaga sp.]|uniref:2'-5' RNA ligase family protein n=1 Tax=Anaerophaga thermohalophila TaxID=177400 RepID=UPI000237C02B|nr:mutarotase [Anaerophaga thermohalophila]MBZ4676231.1 mutarotase [Anaerophaga sp.]MDI3520074.1 hypothetical protein [Anaerophaga sp.]MDK2843119.1 hypothetical protein [Anaerophaga sp.]